MNTISDIRHTVVLNAPIQKVWDAVSTSEGIATWFMPNNFQNREGHEFTIQTPFGTSKCKVTELKSPTRLAFTWGEDWVVSFDLKDLEGKTEFTLAHTGWVDMMNKVAGEQNAIIRDRMNHGWSGIIQELRKLVEA